MSGDRPAVILAGETDSPIAALVRAAGLVAANAGVSVAVIGGLAVTCRLASASHRVTGDVDLVSDDDLDAVTTNGAIAADNLVAAHLALRDPNAPPTQVRLFVDGTKVEIIPTYALAPGQAEGIEPERSRLFVLAHRWALETATVERILVSSGGEATLAVATPAALVAMKLHSIQDRSNDEKRASDAWDLFRLLDRCNADGSITAALAGSSDALRTLALDALDRVFRSDATRTRRWVVAYGDPAWVSEVTDENMGDLATSVIEGA